MFIRSIIKLFCPWQQPRAAQAQPAGAWGEELAARLLKKKGYSLLGRRLRIGRRDEFDLLARDGNQLVFVEVKTRANQNFGRPMAAVDKAKRRHLSRAAVRYLKALKKTPPSFRFDVIEVIGVEGDQQPQINHIQNAFGLERRYRVPSS